MAVPDEDSGSLRRFFLAEPLRLDHPRLAAEDAEHARRVLRVQAGVRILGLDGRGGSLPLRVVRVDRRSVEVAPDGELRVDPPYGDPRAPLPWIEAAVPLPKGGRAEDMLERLVQLGLAGLTPLVTEHTESGARAVSAARLRRLERAAREACKQCGRTWLPRISAPAALSELLARERGSALLALDPRAEQSLFDWAARASARSPLVVVAGPEGGLSGAETGALLDSGASRVRLGPHRLRIETAVEAALAILCARAQRGLTPATQRAGADPGSTTPPRKP